MTTRQRQIRRVDYVDPRGYEYFDVDIDVLVPDPENPRIPPQEFVEIETMLAVYRKKPEGLFKLAEDLAKVGTNPAELLNVTRLTDRLFVVKEGNRRLTARKILRNPEILRDHVTPSEFRRWQKLSSKVTGQLSTRQLIVVGENHDHWTTRRHHGYQGGVGVDGWDREAQARDVLRKLGKRNRGFALISALKTKYGTRFPDIPKNSFSVIERFMDSAESRAQIGVDVDESGHLKLTRGEKSLRMLEEIVKDVNRPKGDKQKLTTRTINLVPDAHDYLQRLETRISGEALPEDEITLDAEEEKPTSSPTRPPGTSGSTTSRDRPPDVLKTFNKPEERRLRAIFDELARARKSNSPNAAMILTRVLLELSLNIHSAKHGTDFEAGDPETKNEILELRKFTQANGFKVSRKLKHALSRASSDTPTLASKLERVLADLKEKKMFDPREADAKRRELNDREVIHLLNDAVHRLTIAPTVDRVDNILEIIAPIFNAIHS